MPRTRPTKPKPNGAHEPKASKHAGGRPPTYKPEFVEQAKVLCQSGATDLDLADYFGVALRTISRWQAEHPEFRQSLKLGKAESDARVERSLFARATGYTYDAIKIFPPKGDGEEPLIVPYREHVPPDTTACIFWLKNRRPDEWRDKVQAELSRQVALQPVAPALPAPEIAAGILDLLRRAELELGLVPDDTALLPARLASLMRTGRILPPSLYDCLAVALPAPAEPAAASPAVPDDDGDSNG